MVWRHTCAAVEFTLYVYHVLCTHACMLLALGADLAISIVSTVSGTNMANGAGTIVEGASQWGLAEVAGEGGRKPKTLAARCSLAGFLRWLHPVVVSTVVFCATMACQYALINRHLGLINAPPLLIRVFPPNDLFHYSFTITKARHIQKYGQDFIITYFPPAWGDPFARIKYGTSI